MSDTREPLLKGLVAATFTPMKSDGAVDGQRIPAVCDFVLDQGADGIFVCGSTGESPSLTVAERMVVAETYFRAAAKRVPVVIHVGHNSLSDARTLAAHAEQLTADAIAVVPPSYYPLTSMDALVECLQHIGEAAPGTPLYYYHIPPITGIDLSMPELLERAEELPTLAGIKFSAAQFEDLAECVEYQSGRYNILFGCDELLLSGLKAGVDGAVGSTYNFMAPHYRRVIDAFESGLIDEAKQHQATATARVEEILRHGGHNALKAAMGILGVDCGPPRLPWRALTAQEILSLEQGISDDS
ncbi:MAG: dihydrodipicolinate synthase family protein [Planctomycetota bacterium]|nr:dihydrodipicolinate synthase family protein [Planctomycetota bacterium]